MPGPDLRQPLPHIDSPTSHADGLLTWRVDSAWAKLSQDGLTPRRRLVPSPGVGALPIGGIKNAGSTAMSQAIRWRLDSAGSPVTYSHVTGAAGAGDGSSRLACSELNQGRFRLPA
ncbi:MAG: hypothetical protein JWQ67_483 [Marmoricola sp.]|nr:hypothetical protein [Marmoricola sp.]